MMQSFGFLPSQHAIRAIAKDALKLLNPAGVFLFSVYQGILCGPA
jgi:hypothetical protein